MENKGDIAICGINGRGEPIFTETEICFNGSRIFKNDLEDFIFRTDGNFSGYCKTARNPYDLIVCCVLISIHIHMTGVKFESDGSIDDFEEAIEFYDKHVGNFKGDFRKSFARKLYLGKSLISSQREKYKEIEKRLNMC